MNQDKFRDLERRVDRIEDDTRDVVLQDYTTVAVGSAATIRTGVVSSSTAASNDHDGNDLSPGNIEVWEYITDPADLERHDPAESYDAQQPIYLTAADHDDTATYADGDRVKSGGNIYEAPGAVAAGTFNAGDWTLLDSEGVKFAIAAVAAGDYDSAEWDAATGDQYIDRTRDTISLVNDFASGAPPEGALVKWLGDKLIGPTCEAQTGWV